MTISTCFITFISSMDGMTGFAVHLFCSVDAFGMGLGYRLVAIITRWLCQFFFMGERGSIVMTPLTGCAAMNEILKSIMTTQAFI
jgi:hypothetical protein